MFETSTIAALATAPAPAGVAVVRVSGPRSRQTLTSLFRAKPHPADDPRRLTLGDLLDFHSGQVIDKAMAVYMPGPRSYTGEDVVEFQFHGSPLLVERVLRSLFAFGVSPAEPGEFTKRAFLNGKMDLIQAEAIGQMIQASNDASLKVASEQLKGRFSRAIDELGEPLREALAEVEATIDFPEESIEPQKRREIRASILLLRDRLNKLVESYSYGHVLRDGFRVLLCGTPNVGKSSLLNALLGKQRAIVSETSGTTRDLIEEQMDIKGHRFVFCDSAGLRDSKDSVEQIGMELARERIGWADLVLLVADATDESQAWQRVLKELDGASKKIWLVVNKVDLKASAIGTVVCDSRYCAQNFYLSVRTGDGLPALQDALVEEVLATRGSPGDDSLIVTNERHRDCLMRAVTALEAAARGLDHTLSASTVDAAPRELGGARSSLDAAPRELDGPQPLELVAADIRECLSALAELVGKTYTEDLLGRIFSRYCIGK